MSYKDPDYTKKYMRDYYQKHRAKKKAYQKAHYKKYRKEIRVREKIRRIKNRDHFIKLGRESYYRNQEKILKRKREDRRLHLKKYKEITKKYYAKHRQRLLPKMRKKKQILRLHLLTYYSKGTPECKICGVKEIPFLAIDHIHGRKTMGHTRNTPYSSFLLELNRKHPKGYQVLCTNCNTMKEIRRHKNLLKSTPMAIKTRYYRKRTKKQVVEHYSNGTLKCSCCGFAEINGLSIDHIKGRKKWKHGMEMSSDRMYSWLKRNNFPKGFQVLCMNCNFAKGQLGKCPHQK